MIGSNEKCLDPWHGFLIILGVCIVILVGIFNEFQGGTHHARIHAKAKQPASAGPMATNQHGTMAQAAFANTSPAAGNTTGEITF